MSTLSEPKRDNTLRNIFIMWLLAMSTILIAFMWLSFYGPPRSSCCCCYSDIRGLAVPEARVEAKRPLGPLKPLERIYEPLEPQFKHETQFKQEPLEDLFPIEPLIAEPFISENLTPDKFINPVLTNEHLGFSVPTNMVGAPSTLACVGVGGLAWLGYLGAAKVLGRKA